MPKRRLASGFTIVELLVVLVVASILVRLIVVGYSSYSIRARDTKLSASADTIADAIKLYIVDKKTYPLGGLGSTGTVVAGTGCTNGINGWFQKGNYNCTVEDTLIETGYLPANFSQTIPSNPNYWTKPNKFATMLYQVSTGSSGRSMLYYSMESPSVQDTSHFNSELTKCGLNPASPDAHRDTYKMNNGICIEFSLPL